MGKHDASEEERAKAEKLLRVITGYANPQDSFLLVDSAIDRWEMAVDAIVAYGRAVKDELNDDEYHRGYDEGEARTQVIYETRLNEFREAVERYYAIRGTGDRCDEELEAAIEASEAKGL